VLSPRTIARWNPLEKARTRRLEYSCFYPRVPQQLDMRMYASASHRRYNGSFGVMQRPSDEHSSPPLQSGNASFFGIGIRRSFLIDGTSRRKRGMHLQYILSAASTAVSFFNPGTRETVGKPTKLLEVGRFPALGCTPPLARLTV
jgi:hypothetical protein